MSSGTATDRARVGVIVGAGARSGVGGALCRKLAAEGLAVVAAGRTPEKLEALININKEIAAGLNSAAA